MLSFVAKPTKLKAFLKEKAAYLLEKHPSSLGEIVVILPNKRAGLYLRKHIAEILAKPTFSPVIFTIDEWIDQFTTEEILDPNSLLFYLYDVHLQIESTPEPFGDFIKWAGILLNDFDDIDRNLVKPLEIFRDLRNIKEIENWSFSGPELSEKQRTFMAFWQKLPDYYEKFESLLATRSKIYRGKAFRNFAAKVPASEEKAKHYFIGFNSLSKSEEIIIGQMIQKGYAEIHFDSDAYYMNNPEHEAGNFIRKFVQGHNTKNEVGKYFTEIPKKIRVIETTGQVAQAKVASTILRQLHQVDPEMKGTVLVLADETLFLPVISSLPSCLDTANITLGYPLKYSAIQRLLDTVFVLQEELSRSNSGNFRYNTILKFLDHPYFMRNPEYEKRFGEFEKNLIGTNKIFFDSKYLFVKFPEMKSLDKLLQKWKNPAADCIAAFDQLSLVLSEKMDEGNNHVDSQIIALFSSYVERFSALLRGFNHAIDLKSFRNLFARGWQYESLAFPGNPLEGLQVLGLLETRAIDFDKIIIIGANEGKLPKSHWDSSFIPWDLRKNAGLPTPDEREASYSNHFYRLLQRSSEVYITYNSTTDGMNTGEKSHYILQLETDLVSLPQHQLIHQNYSPKQENSRTGDTCYQSNAAICKKMDERLSAGISASALNTLIQCPLDFYYKYILGLSESETVEENFEASTFGSQIHDVLEKIFKEEFQIPEKPMDVKTLQRCQGEVEKRLKDSYLCTPKFSEADVATGYNRLAFDISVKYLESFFNAQIREVKECKTPIFIDKTEEKIEVELNLNIAGEKKKVLLKGTIDRIDRIGDSCRIIDYKSGGCKPAKVKLPKTILDTDRMQNLMKNPDSRFARQLLFYGLMFRNTRPDQNNFTAGIISLVNIADWAQLLNITGQDDPRITNDLLDRFEEEMAIKLGSVYSPEFLFTHNPDSDFCEYCS